MLTQADVLDTNPTPQGTQAHRLWLLGGGPLIAHIVMMFGGLSFEPTPILGDSAQPSPPLVRSRQEKLQLADRTQAALHARRSGMT
jgi:hypothetical protein